MSKSELTKERVARERQVFLQKFDTPVLFVKRLLGVAFGLSILGLGIVAIVSNVEAPEGIKRIAFIVAGSCAVIDGMYLLYVALMKIGTKTNEN